MPLVNFILLVGLVFVFWRLDRKISKACEKVDMMELKVQKAHQDILDKVIDRVVEGKRVKKGF